jgi:hypothetical protein
MLTAAARLLAIGGGENHVGIKKDPIHTSNSPGLVMANLGRVQAQRVDFLAGAGIVLGIDGIGQKENPKLATEAGRDNHRSPLAHFAALDRGHVLSLARVPAGMLEPRALFYTLPFLPESRNRQFAHSLFSRRLL